MSEFITNLLNLFIAFFKPTHNVLILVPLGLLVVSGAFGLFVKLFHRF